MFDPNLTHNGVLERKTYAEFLHPHPDKLGEVEYSLREVDQDNRDPRCLPGPPSDAIGVRFFDQIEVEVSDSTGAHGLDPIVCKSPRLSVSPGVTFYIGKTLNYDQVEAGTIGGPLQSIVLDNMRHNDWEHIIIVPGGTVLPFDKKRDSIL